MADELDRIIERALGKWRANVGPTPAAVAGFEAIRDLLREHARGGGLRTKAQEFPPKVVLSLPAAKRGGHVWEFASVSAVEDDVYFDLYPLGLDVILRNLVSPALRRRAYRTDDGFRLPGGGKKFLGEIGRLIPAAHEWFRREVAVARPLPPCQPIDHYLIEFGDGPVDSDPAVPKPRFEPLAAAGLPGRLTRAFGKGPWRRAVLTTGIRLPGSNRSMPAELHCYERSAKPGGREGWKVKRFLGGRAQETACDTRLVYAAASDFRASLEPGRAYRGTAALGRKFQAYVRVVDESGEEYWYPEQFFVAG